MRNNWNLCTKFQSVPLRHIPNLLLGRLCGFLTKYHITFSTYYIHNLQCALYIILIAKEEWWWEIFRNDDDMVFCLQLPHQHIVYYFIQNFATFNIVYINKIFVLISIMLLLLLLICTFILSILKYMICIYCIIGR